MSFAIYNQNTPLQFLDTKYLDAERTVIDNYIHDIVKNYGIDVLYVSQKKNFPIVPHQPTPTEHEILFHAYGDIIKPDYNEPFLTRAYIKFENDLFAINQFGLSNDMSIILFLNKIDFAYDAAIALADNETKKKTFTFTGKISTNDSSYVVSYKDKEINFKAEFPVDQHATNTTKRARGQLTDFSISPDLIGNSFIYASFKRRYSAKYKVEDSKISVSYKLDNIDLAANTVDISGKITCSFVVKNPFKSYILNEQKITPAVGDIILVQTVDNKLEKIEITEVIAENKTVSGINPLLATYAYQCYCKPFIADNATAMTDIAAPTQINANKLETIDNLNQNASNTGDQLSYYEHLYTDSELGDVQQDEIYGGYDMSDYKIDTQAVPLKPNLSQTTKNYFNWNVYSDKSITLSIPPRNYTYSADELYSQLRNLFNEKYLAQVTKHNNLPDVDYSMFNLDKVSYYVTGLNSQFYVDIADENTIKNGYLANEMCLRQIANTPTLFNEFCEHNQALISYINNSYVNKGYKSVDGLPYMSTDVLETYISLISDKQHSSLVQINGIKYVKNDIGKFVKSGQTLIIVDLRDVERNNLDTLEFTQMLTAASPYLPVKPTALPEIKYEFIKGALIPIYEFDDFQVTRLATNGLDLFVETSDLDDNLYRAKIDKLNAILEFEAVDGPYNDKTVNLSPDYSWLSADEYGIYFNPVRGDRILLAGKANEYKMSTNDTSLLFNSDINSANSNTEIITFKNSPYYIKLENSEISATANNAVDSNCQILYVPELI